MACEKSPSERMDQLIAVLNAWKAKGMPEAQARSMASDAGSLSKALANDDLGSLRGVADALISSGSIDCAIGKAYAK